MTSYPDFRPWISTFTDDSINAIAQRLDMSNGNLNRQITGKSQMQPENVVRIASEYGANPLPGLVLQGLLSPDQIVDETGDIAVTEALARATDEQLVTEFKSRLKEYKRKALQQQKTGIVTQTQTNKQ